MQFCAQVKCYAKSYCTRKVPEYTETSAECLVAEWLQLMLVLHFWLSCFLKASNSRSFCALSSSIFGSLNWGSLAGSSCDKCFVSLSWGKWPQKAVFQASLRFLKNKISKLFHYRPTRCITPKRVTSWQGPSPRHWARATQLLSKYRRGGQPLTTQRPIWPTWNLNLRPPAIETNTFQIKLNFFFVWHWAFFGTFYI